MDKSAFVLWGLNLNYLDRTLMYGWDEYIETLKIHKVVVASLALTESCLGMKFHCCYSYCVTNKEKKKKNMDKML